MLRCRPRQIDALNPLTLFVQLFVLGSLILIAMTPIVLVLLVVEHLRTRKYRRGVIVALSLVIGFCGGGVLAWILFSSNWGMPFWTTLEASVNAERYGHMVEHTAENILVGVLVACKCGGVLTGTLAAVGTTVWTHLKHS